MLQNTYRVGTSFPQFTDRKSDMQKVTCQRNLKMEREVEMKTMFHKLLGVGMC